jgi:hypothetical protein
MSKTKIIWIEDTKKYITNLLKRKLRFIFEDKGYKPLCKSNEYEKHVENEDIIKFKSKNGTIDIEHLDYVLLVDLIVLAGWISDGFDNCIFFVDYNLKNVNGDSLNGDEIIRAIRSNNSDAQIVFYSSELTQEQLRKKLGDIDNVRCTIRDNLLEVIVDIL